MNKMMDFGEDKQAGEVKIKPMGWRVFCSRSGNSKAETPFGEYVIQSESDGWMIYLLNEEDAHAAYSTIDFAKAAAQADYEKRIRSALVDVPAVEPVAHIIEGPSGAAPRVFLTKKYDPRRPDFWLDEESRAKHRVTPLYTHPPVREGEDSATRVINRERAILAQR